MKKGILQIILFLLCCVFTLFPSGSQAGTVLIPGFNASVIPVAKTRSIQGQTVQILRVLRIRHSSVNTALPVLKPGGLQQGISGDYNYL